MTLLVQLQQILNRLGIDFVVDVTEENPYVVVVQAMAKTGNLVCFEFTIDGEFLKIQED